MELPVLSSGCLSRQDALNEECICDFCLNRHREDATTKVPLDTVVLKGYIAELKEQNSLLRAQKARQNTAFRIGSTERPGASGSGHKRPRLESTSPVVIEIDIIEDKLSAFRDLNIHDSIYYGDIAPFVHRLSPEQSKDEENDLDFTSNKTYQLILSERDLQLRSDWCQYNLHLPKIPQISRIQHDNIINRVLIFYAPWCLRLHPRYLFRDMYIALTLRPIGAAKPQTPHYSPMLHNAIMALGLAYADDPAHRHPDFRAVFARKASSYIEPDATRPTLATVQALGILSHYYGGLCQQGLGFMYTGLSIRMTQALGLNVDCSAWITSGEITADVVAQRNNVYWSCYALDKCWATYVGRESSIPLPKLPLPKIDPMLDEMKWEWPALQIGSQPCLLSSIFVESCKLLSIIGPKIFEALYNNHKEFRSGLAKIVNEIQLSLQQWYQDLPSKLCVNQNSPPGVLFLHLAYWWMTIIVYRPLFRESPNPNPPPTISTPNSAVKICRSATQKIIELLHLWKELYGLRFTPVTIVQIAFNAGVTALLSASLASPEDCKTRENGFSDANECVSLMLEIGVTWDSAKFNAKHLAKLIRERGEETTNAAFGGRSFSISNLDNLRASSGESYLAVGRIGGTLRDDENYHSMKVAQPPSLSPSFVNKALAPSSPPGNFTVPDLSTSAHPTNILRPELTQTQDFMPTTESSGVQRPTTYAFQERNRFPQSHPLCGNGNARIPLSYRSTMAPSVIQGLDPGLSYTLGPFRAYDTTSPMYNPPLDQHGLWPNSMAPVPGMMGGTAFPVQPFTGELSTYRGPERRE